MQTRASHINRPLGDLNLSQESLLAVQSKGSKSASTDNLSVGACSAIEEEDEEEGHQQQQYRQDQPKQRQSMAYKSTYHEDSDADDEFERSVFVSPTLPPELSPTDSDLTSPEHTPTTFTHSHSGGSHASPTSMITQWSSGQSADFLSSLGLGQYADAIVGMLTTGGGWWKEDADCRTRGGYQWRSAR